MREWLNQDREGLRVSRQLARAAEEWERLGRDAGGLYRGAGLAQVVDWAGGHTDEFGPLERAFLAATTEAAEQETAEREAQRQRELEAARQLAEAEQRRADSEHQRADEQRRSAGQLRLRAVLLGLAFAVAATMAGAAVLLGDQARQQARTAVARELAAASYAAYAAYEAMNVALAAIERVGKNDRAAIRDAVFGTRDYDGILGTWSFTPTGDTTLTMMAVSQVGMGGGMTTPSRSSRRRPRSIIQANPSCEASASSNIVTSWIATIDSSSGLVARRLAP